MVQNQSITYNSSLPWGFQREFPGPTPCCAVSKLGLSPKSRTLPPWASLPAVWLSWGSLWAVEKIVIVTIYSLHPSDGRGHTTLFCLVVFDPFQWHQKVSLIWCLACPLASPGLHHQRCKPSVHTLGMYLWDRAASHRWDQWVCRAYIYALTTSVNHSHTLLDYTQIYISIC